MCENQKFRAVFSFSVRKTKIMCDFRNSCAKSKIKYKKVMKIKVIDTYYIIAIIKMSNIFDIGEYVEK